MRNQLNKGENFITNLLADPKLKLTSQWRRRAKSMRERIVPVKRQEPKDGMLRLTEVLAKRSAGRLARLIKQSARRAATAKYLLAKLHPKSVLRPKLEEQQKFNIITFVAATTELENRGNANAI